MLFLFQRQYYTEFDPNAWVTQPWNAWSSVAFLIPVIIWLIALRGQYGRYFVLTVILPLAVINGVGSFLWHAHSGGWIFLRLDTYPPRVMLFWLGVFFCKLLTGRWWSGVLIFVAWALGIELLRGYVQPLVEISRITFGYIFRALIVIVPALVVLLRFRGRGISYFALTILLLLTAIWFRNLDGQRVWPELLPQGTHFLWHLFSAAAYLPLGRYLMLLMDQEREQKLAAKA